MAFDPTLVRAVDRCRARLGDAADPPILIGGEDRYEAILDAAATETAGYLEAAKHLRAQFRLQATRKSARGVSVDFSDRLAGLSALIADLEAEVSTEAGSSPITFVTATWGASSTDEYSR